MRQAREGSSFGVMSLIRYGRDGKASKLLVQAKPRENECKHPRAERVEESRALIPTSPLTFSRIPPCRNWARPTWWSRRGRTGRPAREHLALDQGAEGKGQRPGQLTRR